MTCVQRLIVKRVFDLGGAFPCEVVKDAYHPLRGLNLTDVQGDKKKMPLLLAITVPFILGLHLKKIIQENVVYPF